MKPTVVNIAKLAKVSPTLVSFVINNNSKQLARMNKDTVERVQRIATKLGYHRNELFAAGRRGKSKFLALIARDVAVEHYARVMEEIMSATETLGYSQKLLKLREVDECALAATRILEYRVCGGIFLGVRDNVAEEFCRTLANSKFPALLIGTDPRIVQGGILITTDENEVMEKAIIHLKGLGHRRLAYVGPNENEMTHRERREAFAYSAEQLGVKLRETDLIPITWDPHDQAEALVKALRSTSRPTAIMAYSDYAALVVLRVARQLGLRVPEDLSIIGYDDNLFGALIGPALTTFHQDLSIIQKRYIPEFINSIEKGILLDSNIKRHVPVTLVQRESTGPAPKKLV